ncbi:MAG: acetyl-CoA carboxylase biotin carboxyl carrier protein subunit [bacterium]|nr:acetyl-CoA carboxylase biotin carboxyl carrier protein subunit [bacterium]
MQLKFRDGTGEHALVVRRHEDHWLVTPDGAPAGVLVREASDGAWLVTRADGTSRRAWVAACGDERLVFCDGVAHRLRRPDPVHADDPDHAQADGPDLRARMPGRVVRLLVVPGQVVATGQPLVIMESMKMETELAAPQAGTVERMAVHEGQIVAQGDLLVAVTPAPAD